jgi:hypothetical protein
MALSGSAAAQAVAIHEKMSTSLASARGNSDLSASAKLKRVAAAYLTAKTALDAIPVADATDQMMQRRALMQRAFGLNDLTSSGLNQADLAANYRDAQDRASELANERDASEALERAEDSNDELLCRAICWQAWNMWPQWLGVVNSYLATRPAADRALQQLQALQGEAIADPAKDAIFTAGQLYLPIPQELTRFSLSQIQAIADGIQAA